MTRPYILILALAFCLLAAPMARPDAFGGGTLLDNVPIPDEPIEVEVGVRIDQIMDVDQRAQNFSAVGTLRMRWQDPKLAYEGGDGGRGFRTYSPVGFVNQAREAGTVLPDFVIQNQQNRRWTQRTLIVVLPDGRASYFERFSVQLHAPDFNFRRYPFDTQKFAVEIVATPPRSMIAFTPMPDGSGIAEKHGEEEWRLENPRLDIETGTSIGGFESARAIFRFEGHRHLTYYVFRIFLPLLLITIVSWMTLFLEEYRRRIEVAGTNLLLLITFNFVIASQLPRLGYTTFLDVILISLFVLNALLIVYNVVLRRLKVANRSATARWVDWHVINWAYPLAHVLVVVIALLVFSI